MPNPRYTSSDAYRQILASAAKRWLATRFTEGDSVADIDRLVDLLDVLLTNPQAGDRLQYDGSKWVNTTGELSLHVPDASGSNGQAIKVYNDTWDSDPGDPLFFIEAENDGSVALGQSLGLLIMSGYSGSSYMKSTHLRLGFFNNVPVAQPATPVTLNDVIAGLRGLGLFA